MAVHRGHEEQTFEMAGNHIAGLATAKRSARDVEVWRTVMDPGSATPPHAHDHEEVIVVLKGRGHGTVGGETVTFEAGDTVILPAGTLHQLFADEPFEAIAAMPLGTRITGAEGEILDLPWRA